MSAAPTVGWACMNYHKLYRRPRGMFFSANDVGEMVRRTRLCCFYLSCFGGPPRSGGGRGGGGGGIGVWGAGAHSSLRSPVG